MIGTAFFVGWVLTLPWMPRIAEKNGRKPMFVASMIVDLIVLVGILLTDSLNLVILLVLLAGAATTARYSVGFVYLMELLPKSAQSFYSAVLNVIAGSVLFFSTLFFRYVSNDWRYFYGLGLALQVINLLCIKFVPESPRALVELQRLDEAESAFKTIARWNKVSLDLN